MRRRRREGQPYCWSYVKRPGSNTVDGLQSREDQVVERDRNQVAESYTLAMGLLDVKLRHWVEVARDELIDDV